jgi:hypothetical protein
VDEIVEKFQVRGPGTLIRPPGINHRQVAPLMCSGTALAFASFNIGRIAQTLKWDGEKQHQDANSRVFNARQTCECPVILLRAFLGYTLMYFYG